MKVLCALPALVYILLAAGQAEAESWSVRITPEKPGEYFTIKAERLKDADEGEVYEFHVAVKLGDDDFKLPNHSRTLRIFNGKEFIASCEVRPTGPDGKRVFSFRVAPKYLEKSTFSYSDWSDGDSAGWWFYLKDFVESK
jgi:hypothetical protein